MRALKLCLLGVLLSILAATPAVRAGVDTILDATDADGAGWQIKAGIPQQLVPTQRLLVNSTNTTLTYASPVLVYLTNMSGNHTLTLPTVATTGKHAKFRIVNACNLIGTTGNLTLQVTSSGNVNNKDTLVVTNTSGDTGAVSFIDCVADGNHTTTNEWFVGIVRR